VTIRSAFFDLNRLAVDPCLAQPVLEGIRIGGRLCGSLMEKSDRNSGLLRSHGKRHGGGQGTQQADELASLRPIELHSDPPRQGGVRIPNCGPAVSAKQERMSPQRIAPWVVQIFCTRAARHFIVVCTRCLVAGAGFGRPPSLAQIES
jgi:hypothetical protein